MISAYHYLLPASFRDKTIASSYTWYSRNVLLDNRLLIIYAFSLLLDVT